jgi:hypothetical protein
MRCCTDLSTLVCPGDSGDMLFKRRPHGNSVGRLRGAPAVRARQRSNVAATMGQFWAGAAVANDATDHLSASGEHCGAGAAAALQRLGKEGLTSEASAVGVGRRVGHNGAWAHATDMENASAHVGCEWWWSTGGPRRCAGPRSSEGATADTWAATLRLNG